MTYLFIGIFVLAVLANLESEPLIAWFGPWLSLAPTVLVLRRWLSSPWRFALGVYGSSIVMGIIAMEGFGMSNAQSARLAGWIFPPVLCVVGAGVVLFRRAVLSQALSKNQLAATDAVMNQASAMIGGATLGALLGAIGGVVIYYGFTVGLIADLLFPENADVLLVSGATMAGVFAGASLGVEGPEAPGD